MNSTASLLVLLVSLLCRAGVQVGKHSSWGKTAGRGGGMWKKNDFWWFTRFGKRAQWMRFENMFELPLTLKPLTVFRIMGVFLVYRLCYLGCEMSLN